MKVIGYTRVSTSTQAEEGLSLDAQRSRMNAYATAYGLELVDVVTDAASARTLQRPGLQGALRRLESGEAGGLLIPKLDRLTRSVRDLGELLEGPFRKEGGFALFSVDDRIDNTPQSRLMLNILTSVAQWEREEIGRRTSQALQESMRQGALHGQLPFGLRRSEQRDARGRQRIEVDPEQIVTLQAMQRARGEGLTLNQIAQLLEANGARTQKGSARWSHTTVSRALSRAEFVLRFAAGSMQSQSTQLEDAT